MITGYTELLNEFRGREKKKDNITIFEIAKIDKNENVWSNILAFFLEPKNDEEIAQIFIESLYSCISNKHKEIKKLPKEPSFDRIEIKREVLTSGKGSSRLDLVLKTSELCIGIENKIYHKLDNPLEEYEELLENEVKETKSKYILIILTFARLEEAEWTDFGYPVIYYSDFFRKLKNKIEEAKLKNKEYKKIVQEFIDLGNKLSQRIEISKEEQQFFRTNKEVIDSFIKRYDEIRESCESNLKVLKQELSNELSNEGMTIDFKIWKKKCLYFEHSYKKEGRGDLRIVMDIRLTVTKGWEINIFYRNTSKEKLVSEIINTIKNKDKELGGRFKLKSKEKDKRAVSTYEYFTSIDDIKVKTLKLIKLFLPPVKKG